MSLLDDMMVFRDTKENPDTWIPKPGDKVVLTDEFYDTLGDGKECAKLARLPYCTIDSVHRIPIGENGEYEWNYEIYVEETGYMVGFSYKKYETR